MGGIGTFQKIDYTHKRTIDDATRYGLYSRILQGIYKLP